jgi:hypothetical protein
MTKIQICTHIKDDGVRCGSPARRGRLYCYHHDLMLRGHRIRPDAPCHIPLIRTSRDYAALVRDAMQRASKDRYSPAEQKSLLYALQVARSVLTLMRDEKRAERKRKDHTL